MPRSDDQRPAGRPAHLDVRISSGFSVDLVGYLQRRKLDVAFVRHELHPDLEYRLVTMETLVAILPRGHPLAIGGPIGPRYLAGQVFIGISRVPRVLRSVVHGYLERMGAPVTPHLEIDNFAMATSLVLSTGGVALLPASINSYLQPSVVSWPLSGEQPTIELVLGYTKANTSPVLNRFLARFDELSSQIQGAPSRCRKMPDVVDGAGQRCRCRPSTEEPGSQQPDR